MLKYILSVLFPEVCYACKSLLEDNEKDICTLCRHELPVTNFHRIKNNPVEKVFYGRVELVQATSLFRFEKKGKVQQLLHNLKYRGQERIGTVLGQWLGEQIKHMDSYKEIDLVIPVPLYKKRLRKRGYNQVEGFGKQLALRLEASYSNSVLIKTLPTKTQVFKGRQDRINNLKDTFKLQDSTRIKNTHLLLVDDIITTGATIEACVEALKKTTNVKISVATIAIA